MHTLVIVLLLLVILFFLSPATRIRLRPVFLAAVPVILTLVFSGLALASGAFSFPLALLVLAYCLAPVLVALVQGPAVVEHPTWLDFAIILMLWLPLEFSLGAQLIPKPA